jgi:uncharacterized protein
MLDTPSIRAALDDLALARNIHILYACESGSRAWGFASPDSDFDVRFIYVRPAREYLRLSPPDDTIEVPITGDLDLAGWDLMKACRLMRKSNPPLLEWLGSPLVYVENPAVVRLRTIATEGFSDRACAEHYLSMARMNHKHTANLTTVIRKKYLYLLRPLACVRWLLERESFPPTAFEDVLAGVAMTDDVRGAIDQLVADKKVNHEMGKSAANPVLQAHIDREMTELLPKVRLIAGRTFPEQPLNDFIGDILLPA